METLPQIRGDEILFDFGLVFEDQTKTTIPYDESIFAIEVYSFYDKLPYPYY